MPEERPDAQSQIDECVAKLKSKIPPMEHGAVESRLEELLNDSSASADEVTCVSETEGKWLYQCVVRTSAVMCLERRLWSLARKSKFASSLDKNSLCSKRSSGA